MDQNAEKNQKQNVDQLQRQVKEQSAEIQQLNKKLQLGEQKAAEIAQKESALQQKEALVAKRDVELAQEQKTLNQRAMQVQALESQAQSNFPALFEQQFSAQIVQIKQRESAHQQAVQKHQADEEKLRQRTEALRQAEQARDDGFKLELGRLQDALHQKRQAFEQEVLALREQRMGELESLIGSERSQRLQAVTLEIQQKRTDSEAEMKNQRDLLEQEIASFEAVKKKVFETKAKLVSEQDTLTFDQRKLALAVERLDVRTSELNEEVIEKMSALKQSLEEQIQQRDAACERLRSDIQQSAHALTLYKELERKLGDENPEVVLHKLKTQAEELQHLHKELLARPTREMQESFDDLLREKERLAKVSQELSEENLRLREEARLQSGKEMSLLELQDSNNFLKSSVQAAETLNNKLHGDLKRLTATYETPVERDARIRDIKAPYFSLQSLPARAPKSPVSELEWLDSIDQRCTEYGLKFPRRILHAFHTALKTAEWSPLTVLSGVSGTGKSELPKLYSFFGGVNFMSLAVQPNWDTQEAMLGFFNSIDNRFDAQPVLRFLSQTQEKNTAEYPGLFDTMNIVLLDEMNLAHVELYFAEFLSKLELRRGKRQDGVGKFPSIDVKLGSGIEPFELALGRNVLWVGTMNQDETTKTLSDKVLDRGTLINFPRPTKLERRQQLLPLANPQQLLLRSTWDSWCRKESAKSFNDEQIKPYKAFVEDMNESLSKVGRALGHRVWQSIEYYMANYPDVLEAEMLKDDFKLQKAMKIAFEDQLVQKVMPKLRGIETTGKSKSDCLDKIRALLDHGDYAIVDDFDLACKFGYGQFMWCSANYLNVGSGQDHTDTDDSLEIIATIVNQDAAKSTAGLNGTDEENPRA